MPFAEPAEPETPSSATRSNADDVVDDPRRVVDFDAVHNFRDLGGYRLADGRTIGWGRLFRADGLYRATEHDIELFDGLGLRTVVDLRSTDELSERGAYPVGRHPVGFHHVPVIDVTHIVSERPDFPETEQGAVDFLVWAYREMLIAGGPSFAEAIRLVAVPGATPAVFHCGAGKDRSGLLAALILGGLGVDDDVIVSDYVLSEAAMERMRAWVADHDEEMQAMLDETPAFMLAAHPDAMRFVLAELRSTYGSVAGYLATIGIGAAVLDELADALTS